MIRRYQMLWLLLLLLPLSVGAEEKPAVVEKNVSPLSDSDLKSYQACRSDRDCIAVTNGCCDCANGGQDVAVNRHRLEAFRARFACVDVVCTMRAAVPPCGSGVVSCIEKQCRYLEAKDAAFGAGVSGK